MASSEECGERGGVRGQREEQCADIDVSANQQEEGRTVADRVDHDAAGFILHDAELERALPRAVTELHQLPERRGADRRQFIRRGIVTGLGHGQAVVAQDKRTKHAWARGKTVQQDGKCGHPGGSGAGGRGVMNVDGDASEVKKPRWVDPLHPREVASALMRFKFPRSVLAAAAFLAACSSQNDLAPASLPNVVDTLTLGALHSSPISAPSAYSVADGNAVRTDLTTAFDFAYDVDAAGRHVFLTLEVLGLGNTSGSGPGLQFTSTPFDQVSQAPSNGYITGDTIVVDSGSVLILRSRIVCSGLGVPLYGKLEVLSFDDTPGNRRITFQALANQNCGYKSLLPGLPRN